MKHSAKITILLLAMFLVTQLIGIAVINAYSPQTSQVTNQEGEVLNVTTHNLPYGLEPPKDLNKGITFIQIIVAFVIAVAIMLILMKYKIQFFIRLWFFFVVTIALSLTLNVISLIFGYPSYLAVLVALPLAFFKIFKRNIIIHNVTELAIYPGIAAIFVPLLNIWFTVILLILISIYDMYAVWHAGFMQKMAKYQIQKLKIFSGFFIPYMGKKQRQNIQNLKSSPKKLKNKKLRINVALLGGGDVVFPMILAGVVYIQMGLIQSLLIAIGATAALAFLFYISKKGKFYPAMPFITLGCFAGLALAFLI
jgi:presenilin-like A22 family membrane protease